jgi:hypothetical protein
MIFPPGKRLGSVPVERDVDGDKEPMLLWVGMLRPIQRRGDRICLVTAGIDFSTFDDRR